MRVWGRVGFWVVLAGLGYGLRGAPLRAEAGKPGAAWGVRLDGGRLKELAPGGERAVVLFFVATDCPVSNRSFPEMNRLREEFGRAGVRFWFVYANTNEQAGAILPHQRAFGAAAEDALQDPDGVLVRLSHAVATPEAVVLRRTGGGWEPVYAGRIDDRYVRLGVERTVVSRHFAEDAIRAVLAGRRPAAAEGAPVGCAIMNPGVR